MIITAVAYRQHPEKKHGFVSNLNSRAQSNISDDLSERRKEYEDCNTCNAFLREYDVLKREHSDFQKEIKRLRQSASDKSEINQLREQLKQLEDENKSLQAKYLALEASKEEMEKRSWLTLKEMLTKLKNELFEEEEENDLKEGLRRFEEKNKDF